MCQVFDGFPRGEFLFFRILAIVGIQRIQVDGHFSDGDAGEIFVEVFTAFMVFEADAFFGEALDAQFDLTAQAILVTVASPVRNVLLVGKNRKKRSKMTLKPPGPTKGFEVRDLERAGGNGGGVREEPKLISMGRTFFRFRVKFASVILSWAMRNNPKEHS